MEGLTVNYDLTVRDSDGSVVQVGVTMLVSLCQCWLYDHDLSSIKSCLFSTVKI